MHDVVSAVQEKETCLGRQVALQLPDLCAELHQLVICSISLCQGLCQPCQLAPQVRNLLVQSARRGGMRLPQVIFSAC